MGDEPAAQYGLISERPLDHSGAGQDHKEPKVQYESHSVGIQVA